MKKEHRQILDNWVLDIDVMLPQVESMPERANEYASEVEQSSGEISSNMHLTLSTLKKALREDVYALTHSEIGRILAYADSLIDTWSNIEHSKARMRDAGLDELQIYDSILQTKEIAKEARVIKKLFKNI